MTGSLTKISWILTFSILLSGITFASFPDKFEMDGLAFQHVPLEQITQEIQEERENICRSLAERYKGAWQVTSDKGLKVTTFVPADEKRAYEFFIIATEEELKKSVAMNSHTYEVHQGEAMIAKLKLISACELQKLSDWRPIDGQSLPRFLDTDLILGLEHIETKDPLTLVCAFMRGFLVDDRAQHRLILMKELVDQDDLADLAYARFLSIQCHLIVELSGDTLGKAAEIVKPDPVFVPAQCGSKLISQRQAPAQVKASALYSQREIYEFFILKKK